MIKRQEYITQKKNGIFKLKILPAIPNNKRAEAQIEQNLQKKEQQKKEPPMV